MLLVTTYFAFKSSLVQTRIISIITHNIEQKINADISIRKVDIAFFRKVVLSDVYIGDQQKDTLIFAQKLVAEINLRHFRKKTLIINKLELKSPFIKVKRDAGGEFNFDYLLQYFQQPITKSDTLWKIKGHIIAVSDGQVQYYDPEIDPRWVKLTYLQNVQMEFDSLQILPDNQLHVNIKKLSFETQGDLHLKSCTSSIDYVDSLLRINNLCVETNNSKLLIDSLNANFSTFIQTNQLADLDFDLTIKNLSFGFADISFLVKSFQDNKFNANFSGRLNGTINDLHCRNFQLLVGDFTKLNGDAYFNGLPDINSTYIFFDLNESFANLNEIRNLNLPQNISKAFDNMPSFLDNVGEFTYRGNFTGFIDNFVAYGTAYSNLGKISTDISFKPHRNEQLQVNGHLTAENLDVRTIFKNDILNKLSLNGDINGFIDHDSHFDFAFNGVVNALDINNYRFNNINLDGSLTNDFFNGNFIVDDPYLQMDFKGKLDLRPKLPVFEFLANIDNVNLADLNIIKDPGAVSSLLVDANFEGNSIDNVKGELIINKLFYKNKTGELNVDYISLYNSPSEEMSIFRLRSDLVDGDISGHYNFSTIKTSIFTFLKYYLPSSLNCDKKSFTDVNNFNYQFHFKNIEPLLELFIPGLYVVPDVEVAGFYHPDQNGILLETSIPFIRMGKKGLEDFTVEIKGDTQNITCNAFSKNLRLSEKMNIRNLTIASSGKNDSLELNIDWNNFENKIYRGNIKTLSTFVKTDNNYPLVSIQLEPSEIVLSDSLWVINKSEILIDSSLIFFNNLAMHCNDQQIALNGGFSKDTSIIAYANVNNIELSMLHPFIGQEIITGLINGNARLNDVYSKFKLDMDLVVDHFAFNKGELGTVYLNSKWDNTSDKLISTLSLVNKGVTSVEAHGSVDPLNNSIDFLMDFDQTPLTVLEVFLPSAFNKYKGTASGNVHVYGNVKHLMMDGELKPGPSSGLGITYLNTSYEFNEPVIFNKDSMIFKNIYLVDANQNKGKLDGYIYHQTFNKMFVDLNVKTDRLLVLNTTVQDNQYFYGKGFARGNVKISGKLDDILIDGDVRTEKGSSIFIPFEGSENAVKYDFIEFVNTQVEEESKINYNVVTSGLNMNFDVEITPDAKVQIIFKSQIGDIIRGEGSGNLQVRIDKNYNIALYGNYIIDHGDYLFTLKNVINKRFSIESGSRIEWIGDPYAAIIDIKAVYKVKTSLKDLFPTSYENIDLTRRIPVDCILQLSESLIQPRIDFLIDLPTSEERVKDQVKLVMVTPEIVTRQFISLLMMGRFYTPEYFAGRATAETGVELVGTTASELISNQVSNWFSQITDVFDVGFNWRRGNEITDDQIEVAFSTQLFNNRVLLNSNTANNTNQNSKNDAEIISDFDLKIKLTENGKLQFKAYNRSNDDLIYDTAPYTQGVGFLFREEFNTLKELWQRYTAIFKRKDKKAVN